MSRTGLPVRRAAAGLRDVGGGTRPLRGARGRPQQRLSQCRSGGKRPRLWFQKVPEGKSAKNRLHLDVRAAPGLLGEERMSALEAECERLMELGATRLRRFDPAPPMSNGFIVMADPEGNEFCLD